MDFEFIHLQEVDSTSDYIKRGLKNGEFNSLPVAVSATMQTAGRGRLINRSFYSPEGGLYFSCAFAADMVKCGAEIITLATGTAVVKAFEEICREPFNIKWVNDVLYKGKKVCGILCESVGLSENDPVFIVGIGVNLPNQKLNGFMQEKVGTLPVSVAPNTLMGEILKNLTEYYSADEDVILNGYNAHLSAAGKRVEILKGNERSEATVLGACAGGLECIMPNGSVHTVRTCDEIVTDLYSV